jgi:hypothetical protein
MTEFQHTLAHLRSDFLAESAVASVMNLFKHDFAGDPYAKIPPGTIVTMGADGVKVKQPTSEGLATYRALAKAAKEEEARQKAMK